MIVVDASAALELVLRTVRADAIMARLFDHPQALHAPHLIDVEVVQGLRRLLLAKEVTPERTSQGLDYFRSLAVERHAHDSLLKRIWALRSSLSAYDATYVALAEVLSAPLLTCDERLSRSHGHTAKIELIPLN